MKVSLQAFVVSALLATVAIAQGPSHPSNPTGGHPLNGQPVTGRAAEPITQNVYRSLLATGRLPTISHDSAEVMTATAEDAWPLLAKSLMPVPDVFRSVHEDLAEAGAMLTRDVELDDAHDLLKRGEVILRVNDRPFQRLSDLPAHRLEDCVFRVLCHDGSVVDRVAPAKTDRLVPDDLWGQMRAYGEFQKMQNAELAPPPAVPCWLPPISGQAVSRSTAFAGGQESVSVQNRNGNIIVDATLMIDGTPQKLQLRGTSDEIDRQLDELPPPVRRAIQARVQY